MGLTRALDSQISGEPVTHETSECLPEPAGRLHPLRERLTAPRRTNHACIAGGGLIHRIHPADLQAHLGISPAMSQSSSWQHVHLLTLPSSRLRSVALNDGRVAIALDPLEISAPILPLSPSVIVTRSVARDGTSAGKGMAQSQSSRATGTASLQPARAHCSCTAHRLRRG